MITGNKSITWKVVTALQTSPPGNEPTNLFSLSKNTGLYSQFGVRLESSHVPYFLQPTNVFEQAIKNLVRSRFKIEIEQKKLPFTIFLPFTNTDVRLHLSPIRLFPPSLLSLTLRVTGLPATLTTEQLIDIQRLNDVKLLSDIAKWTIGMVQTLNHRHFTAPNSVKSKPLIYMDSVCRPEDFPAHLNENRDQYAGILIRNRTFRSMDPTLTERIFDENRENNLKILDEQLLLNRQGILYVTPVLDERRKEEAVKRFARVEDLFELALITDVFLKEYVLLESIDGEMARSVLSKMRLWVQKPGLIFSESTSNTLMWNQLSARLQLHDRLEEIPDDAASRQRASQATEVEPSHVPGVDELFESITVAIESSAIAQSFKDIAGYDLDQARVAYSAGAYKCCVVMLGAVLEGLMLGTIVRQDVLHRLRDDPRCPGALKQLGLHNPNLADLVASRLGFEDYKTIVHYLFPQVEKLKVEGIQVFRNAVHPWKAITEPSIYGDFSSARALNHLTSLAILVDHILARPLAPSCV